MIMKRKFSRFLAVALTLSMALAQTVFAAGTYYVNVSISGANKTVSGQTRYVADSAYLAAEVVDVIAQKRDDLAKTFTEKPDFQEIVDDGLEAFKSDEAWAEYVAQYTNDVTGDDSLKSMLTDKTTKVSALTPGQKYTMTYNGYTVTVELESYTGGGSSGGGGGSTGGSTSEPVQKPEVGDFSDVTKDSYCYDAVKWARENGITSGISETEFGVDFECTRAQIITFLWNAAGCPEAKQMSDFKDVADDAYYAKAVAWGVENGITAGISEDCFGPDLVCTRAQAMTLLYHIAGSPATKGLESFDDVASDAYYAQAVAWGAENGITSGTSATTFSPEDNCTRGQIVTFLYKFYGNK